MATLGDIGLGSIGGVAYSTLHAGISGGYGNFEAGVFGRIRFPLADLQHEGTVRRRDFDEASDYVHLLRYMTYYRDIGSNTVQFRGGELVGQTFGRGTLLRDYSNIADPDHLHGGIRVDWNHPEFRASLLLDNVVNPSVIAARAAVIPMGRAPNIWRGFGIGTTWLIDPRAPVNLIYDEAIRPLADSAFNLRSNNDVLVLGGVDAFFQFGNATQHATPYADLNTSFRGVGLHMGVEFRSPVSDWPLAVFGKLEYRVSSGGYSPDHVATFYDVDRFQGSLNLSEPATAAALQRDPKLGLLRQGVFGGHGVLSELGLTTSHWLTVAVGGRYHPGPDSGRFWVRASSQPFKDIDIGTYVLMRGLESQRAAGIAALAEARWQFSRYIYSVAQYVRTWALSERTGFFAPRHTLNIGVGLQWSNGS